MGTQTTLVGGFTHLPFSKRIQELASGGNGPLVHVVGFNRMNEQGNQRWTRKQKAAYFQKKAEDAEQLAKQQAEQRRVVTAYIRTLLMTLSTALLSRRE